MFINAGLGILGIYSQIGWILGLFGRNADDYPAYVHVVPVLYYVLYTFLLRQLLLDVTRSRDNPGRRRLVEAAYVAVSLGIYGLTLWLRSARATRSGIAADTQPLLGHVHDSVEHGFAAGARALDATVGQVTDAEAGHVPAAREEGVEGKSGSR